MTESITSVSNPKIKNLVALQQKSSERRLQGLFVVEGRRELQHCLEAGYAVSSVFVCPEIAGSGDVFPRSGSVGCSGRELPPENVSLRSTLPSHQAGPLPLPVPRAARFSGGTPARNQRAEAAPGAAAAVLPAAEGSRNRKIFWGGSSTPSAATAEPGGSARVFEVSRQVYQKISYRDGTEGVIAEVRCRDHRLQNLQLRPNPLICVLESVEKPGNLGAVLRSADASGADAVIVCDPRTDLYNPNLIRASIGAAFTVPVAVCDSAEAIKWLKANKIKILTAQLQDSELYYDSDMTAGTAIVMGTEDRGLSEAWRRAADAHIRIPMLGRLDSLNVSVSAAILLFEALRQRNNG